jgi:hypothetical protein
VETESSHQVRHVPARPNFAGTSVIPFPIRSWFCPVSPPEVNRGIRITVEAGTSDPDLFRRFALRFGGVNAPIVVNRDFVGRNIILSPPY